MWGPINWIEKHFPLAEGSNTKVGNLLSLVRLELSHYLRKIVESNLEKVYQMNTWNGTTRGKIRQGIVVSVGV